MKRFLLIAVAAPVALTTLCGQSKSELRNAKQDAASAARTLKREGFKPIELGGADSLLERYFLKTQSGCRQIVGTAEDCITLNVAKTTALANAANEYAAHDGGVVRGRIVSSTSSMSGEQLDNVVASYERIVQKEIKGELIPFVTCVRNRKNRYSARIYCLVDADTASKGRIRALEEQSLAQTYGSIISGWIDEGFSSVEDGNDLCEGWSQYLQCCWSALVPSPRTGNRPGMTAGTSGVKVGGQVWRKLTGRRSRLSSARSP